MKKLELARRLARHSGLSPAEAADQLDREVHRILARLRKGLAVPLPGLGTFRVSPDGILQFETKTPKGGTPHARR
jgi:nucleoid DNA-binding protein